MWAMSAPAQKAFSPAPVMTTARKLGRGRDLVEAAVEVVEHLGREGVERLGTVERDDRDGVAAFQIDGHGASGIATAGRRG